MPMLIATVCGGKVQADAVSGASSAAPNTPTATNRETMAVNLTAARPRPTRLFAQFRRFQPGGLELLAR